jgi:hypothetical protein
MRRRGTSRALALALVLASCAAGEAPAHDRGAAAAPPVAPATADDAAPDRGLGAPPRPVVRGLEVVPVEVTEAEDGRGAVVPAVRPVALDVIADGWPGRALDPVLLVGDELRFRRYRHPAPGVLRFVAADVATLPAGATVAVQWGDDAASRLVVADALEVPR